MFAQAAVLNTSRGANIILATIVANVVRCVDKVEQQDSRKHLEVTLLTVKTLSRLVLVVLPACRNSSYKMSMRKERTVWRKIRDVRQWLNGKRTCRSLTFRDKMVIGSWMPSR